MKSLLSTAYWPNLHYFYYVLNSEVIFIEQFENYQKQSFRNRTQILSANGPLDLSIPVKKKSRVAMPGHATKERTKDVEISYAENWQLNHWRAITSAYKNSPYFEHFEDEIQVFYSKKFENLLDYNRKQLDTVLKILRVKKEIQLTTQFEKEPKDKIDCRENIHPKLEFKEDNAVRGRIQKPYYQTFEEKFDFVPNLSILDLIFNTGLESLTYLCPPITF
jgi:hypothetical protein